MKRHCMIGEREYREEIDLIRNMKRKAVFQRREIRMESLEDFFDDDIGSRTIDFRVMDLSLYSREMTEYELFLRAHIKEKRNLEIEATEVEKRVYPTYSLEGAKTVIVFFVPYWNKGLIRRRNTISIHAQGLDYHIVVGSILQKVVEKLQFHYPEEKFSCQCDTGLLSERFFAIQSGLCMKGKNGMAIHPKYGSYGFLGMVLTTLKIPSPKGTVKECMNCGRCTSVCPGSVLGNRILNYQTCLSWLTQKKELNLEEKEGLKKNRMIYGCDRCQEVCPHNREVYETDIEAFRKGLIASLDFLEIMNHSNRSFKKQFGDRTFSWRGKKLLERNIRLIEEEKYVGRNFGSKDENF